MRQKKFYCLIAFSIFIFLGCDNRSVQEYIQSVKWQYQDNQIQEANINFNLDENKVQSFFSPSPLLFMLKGTATEFPPHVDFSTFVGDHLLPACVYLAFFNVKLKVPELLLTQFTVPEKKQIEKLTVTRFVYEQLGNVAKVIEASAEVGRQSSNYHVLQFQLAQIKLQHDNYQDAFYAGKNLV
ncbi:MAG: hypothetical protein ACI8R9_000476 [Paraglaciecola sp.]|jgi:hypothetical protein